MPAGINNETGGMYMAKVKVEEQLVNAADEEQMTEQQISVRISRALAILDTLSVPAERLEYMKSYVESLVGRKK